MNILELKNISKQFGNLKIIRDLSFSVPEHCVFGFLGKNGAGKTTTMKMILGFLKPDAGSITVCGERVTYGNTKTNRNIGYLPDIPEFYGYMTPKEYLKLCGEIIGIPGAQLSGRINEMLTLVGLDGSNRRIRGFSRGMKQRLGIAQALIGEPKLLICDEPTSALDPVGRKEILDIMLVAKKQTTILFSTHILSDVERICDSIGILDHGNLVLEGSVAEIKNNNRNDAIQIELADFYPAKELAEKMKSLSYIQGSTVNDNKIDIRMVKPEQYNEKLLEFLVAQKVPLLRFEVMEPSLENLFMEVVQ